METRVHRRKLLHPDVLEYSKHGKLSGLIDQRVVGDYREVEMQTI
jgi:hypothetical protein